MPRRKAGVQSEPQELVAAFCERLAELPIDEAARRNAKQWSPLTTVPREFDPFVKTKELSALTRVIEKRSVLFWHPIVLRVVFSCLMQDEPDELAVDQGALELLEALATGLLRVPCKIERAPEPKQRGRKPRIPIPRATLYADWRKLQQELKKGDSEHLLQGKPEEMEGQKSKLVALAARVLHESDIKWSDRRGKLPNLPEGWQTWSLSRRRGWALSHLDEDAWDVDLNGAVEAMFQAPRFRERAVREGRAAYLAYAILGALLSDSAERLGEYVEGVRNTIDRHLYKRCRKSPR